MNSAKKNIEITGMGIISSFGLGKGRHLEVLQSGEAISKKNASLYVPVPDFNPKEYIKNKKSIRFMDRQTLLACVASAMAVKDFQEQYSEHQIDQFADSLIFGSGYSESIIPFLPAIIDCITEKGTINYDKLGNKGYRNLPPLWILSRLPNTSAGQISIENNIRGLNYSVANGFANGMVAVGNAYNLLKQERSIRCFCGSAQGVNYPDQHKLFQDKGVCSLNKYSSMPFSQQGNGGFPSEASCMFIMKKNDGSEPLKNCSICSYVQMYIPNFDSADVKEKSALYKACMEKSVKQASITTDDIDFIQANAFGIAEMDQAEALAIKNLFCNNTVVTSSGNFGYSFSANGALSIALAILQLQNGFVAAFNSLEELFYAPAINYVNKHNEEKEMKYCLVNSFDHLGMVGSMVIKKNSTI